MVYEKMFSPVSMTYESKKKGVVSTLVVTSRSASPEMYGTNEEPIRGSNDAKSKTSHATSF